MTFPDNNYDNISLYADAYFERIKAAGKSIDRSRLELAATLLTELYTRGGSLFVCGNGGSAAISGTFVADHVKLIRSDTTLIPRVFSLVDNISTVTAISNDISYEDVFSYQLSVYAKPRDILLTVSSSGDSENVVRAAQWARNNELPIIAFTGFEGGRSADLASVNLHVVADNYGVIEDTHQSLMHILAQYIRLAAMPISLIGEKKF
jgi:D-sedoheptulose 7-phosphate isomerase